MSPAKKIKLIHSDGTVEPNATRPAASTPPQPVNPAPGAPSVVPGQQTLTGYVPAAPQAGMQSFMAYPVQGVPGQPQAVVIQQGVPPGAVVYQPVTMAGQQSIIGYAALSQAGTPSMAANPAAPAGGAAPAAAPAIAAPLAPPAPPPRSAVAPPLVAPNPALKTTSGTPPPSTPTSPPPTSRSSTVTRTKAPAAPIGLKKVEVMQAPAAAHEPERKKAEKLSKAARDLLVRMGVAVVLFIVGQVMGSVLPILRLWEKTGEPPAIPLAGNVAFLVLVAGCLLWRKKGPTAIASGLIFLSALTMFLLVPLGSAVTSLGIPRLTELLPNTGEAAGAFCFLMGSFGLATSDATGRWALAGVLGVAGLIVPWTPLQSYMPDLSGMFASSATPAETTGTAEAGTDAAGTGTGPGTTPPATGGGTIVLSGGSTAPMATTTSTTPDFTIQLPTGWSEVSKGDPSHLLAATTESRDIMLLVSKEPLPAESSFDAYADAKLVQMRAQMSQASGMIVGVPGRKDRKRLFIMADTRVAELLLVVRKEACFSVFCQGDRSAIQDRRSELDRIFQTFEPR